MHRRGSRQYLLDLFKKIKEEVPNAILRTTIMCGFPGETEEDIDDLIDFMNQVKFDHLGVFTYSREKGTPSYSFDDQVPAKIKSERYNRIMKEQIRRQAECCNLFFCILHRNILFGDRANQHIRNR